MRWGVLSKISQKKEKVMSKPKTIEITHEELDKLLLLIKQVSGLLRVTKAFLEKLEKKLKESE